MAIVPASAKNVFAAQFVQEAEAVAPVDVLYFPAPHIVQSETSSWFVVAVAASTK